MSWLVTNWKTTLGGVAALMVWLANLAGAPIPGQENIMALILAWIGLASKDGNVSGTK